MTDAIELPYPQIQQATEDKSIKQQYAELVAREQREAEAALAAKLDGINISGDIAELKSNLKLRCAFTARHGWQRFGELNKAHLRRQAQERRAAELAERESKRQISTSQSRILALNKQRKATVGN